MKIQRAVKRILDITGSLVGIAVTAPVVLAAAIAIKLDSKGPVFFLQTRVGLNGRHFKIVKLRTMAVGAESQQESLMALNEVSGGLMFKIKNDPRVTRVGAFLRRTSIDEIPQFLNVLTGSMSLVGTRPPTVSEVSRYRAEHWRRLSVKPGITGLWQITGRSSITSFDEVVALDTRYIESWSLWSDVKIIVRTVSVVIGRKGAY
jgi:exopolysaccharide biosynthesis polyprenyl glycosylphosphotransferase